MIKVSEIINDARCKSSWCFLNENCLVITSCIKKKLNIGNNKVIDKTKVCKLVDIISDKFSTGTNPPEAIVVKARLNELIDKIKKQLPAPGNKTTSRQNFIIVADGSKLLNIEKYHFYVLK